MRRIGFALIILPLVGVALGAGGATLFWSGMVSRAHANNVTIFKQTQDALRVAEKWKGVASDWEIVSEKHYKGWQDCMAQLRR
jgi:hypothetical protein